MATLMAIALAGCGGGDGAPGSNGSNGTNGANGTNGTNGNNGKDAITAVNVGSNTVAASTVTSTAWAALAPQVSVNSVTIASAPVVKFTVKDAAGNPVLGLASKSQSATATVAGLTNIAFTLAKLVPGTTLSANGKTSNAEPSKWVSYLVTRPPTVAEKTATPATSSCNAATGATWCGTYPASDNQGTLVDNGDGSYQYTFYRDITQTAAIVASLTDSADGLSKKADMGDLNYNAALTHRLGIIISGSAPGTGTNTPNAVAFAATATPVPMVNTFNIGYDFVPAGGTPTSTRDIVVKASCSGCHDGKGIGHVSTASATNGVPPGAFVGRNDPRLCVTCHTDQIKYSFNAGEAPMLADGVTFATQSGTNAAVRPAQAILGGRAVGNYPNLIHKTHMGDELVKQGYNFNNGGGAQMFNSVGLPQSPANCTKCHDGSSTAVNKTTDGNNWNSVPSILACGSCHDGINFATGGGVTLVDKAKDVAAGKPVGTTQTGHVGGAKSDNATCALCHDATTIPVYHRTNAATPNNPIAKAGVATFAYDIKAATVDASSGQATVTFQIKKDGAVVTALAVPTLVTNAATGAQVVSPAYEPILGFAGSPSFYVAYAVPQDGIATPADFNTYQSVSLTNLLITSGSPKAGSLSNSVVSGAYQADANGYFTATISGDVLGQPKGTCTAPVVPAAASCVVSALLASPIVLPTNAKMVTVAIIGAFTQKGLAAYPYIAANVSVNPNLAATGGLNRPGILKKIVATGYTARRVIVDAAKCNTCHEQLGTSPAFHGQSIAGQSVPGTGPRNDPTACNICHNNTRTSNGWIANSNTYVHGIHGASKRTVAFTWAGVSATDNFSKLGYPGVLKDCNQCHLPNTVNFGATGASLQPNLLWPTGATGTAFNTTTTAFRNSPYVTAGVNYGNGFSYTPAGSTVAAYTPAGGTLVAAHVAGAGGEIVSAQGTTLVSSPISSACFSCHDTPSAKNHMVTQGGSVYETRSTALNKGEACLVCHGAGKDQDVVTVHK